jgi:hypothetical protein
LDGKLNALDIQIDLLARSAGHQTAGRLNIRGASDPNLHCSLPPDFTSFFAQNPIRYSGMSLRNSCCQRNTVSIAQHSQHVACVVTHCVLVIAG